MKVVQVIRRLEVKNQQITHLSNEVIFKELIMRGVTIPDISTVSSNPKEYRDLLNKYFWHEYAQELENQDIEPKGDVTELREKCRLLKILLQRAHITTICRNKRKIPIDMFYKRD